MANSFSSVLSDVDTAAISAANSQFIHRSPLKSNKQREGNFYNSNSSNKKRRYTVGADVFKSYQKKRRKDDNDNVIIPPTVFLLGGNIHDPLGLNGIKAGGSRQITPESSPPSTLNEADQQTAESTSDTIVSPVVLKGNSRIQRSNPNSKNNNKDSQKNERQTMLNPDASTAATRNSHKSTNKKNERFQYGNYNRYYGYRNVQECDPRIELFHKDLFAGKDVLDIGCNTGHVTLIIARDFAPRRIVGIDIDPSLISVATKNIRHYITEKMVSSESFPISMPILYGPITNFPRMQQDNESFPNNVLFVAVNYVPETDESLVNQHADYDCIMCLSLTKWIHLNWGDDGIKRMFKRIFLHLRPGGCLLIEPQPWNTYHKKSKLTVNFQAISSVLLYSHFSILFSLTAHHVGKLSFNSLSTRAL